MPRQHAAVLGIAEQLVRRKEVVENETCAALDDAERAEEDDGRRRDRRCAGLGSPTHGRVGEHAQRNASGQAEGKERGTDGGTEHRPRGGRLGSVKLGALAHAQRSQVVPFFAAAGLAGRRSGWMLIHLPNETWCTSCCSLELLA